MYQQVWPGDILPDGRFARLYDAFTRYHGKIGGNTMQLTEIEKSISRVKSILFLVPMLFMILVASSSPEAMSDNQPVPEKSILILSVDPIDTPAGTRYIVRYLVDGLDASPIATSSDDVQRILDYLEDIGNIND